MQAHNRNDRICSEEEKTLRMSKWRWWYVWCKAVKASKKNQSVVILQCSQNPVVHSAVVLIFACAGKSKNQPNNTFLYLSAETFTYVSNFSKLNSNVISWSRESEKQKHWHYMYSIRFSRQSFLWLKKHTTNTHLQKFSSKNASGEKALSPWLNPYVGPIFVGQKTKMIFLPKILTHKFQFGKTCNAEHLRF